MGRNDAGHVVGMMFGDKPSFGAAPSGYVPGMGRGLKANGQQIGQDQITFGEHMPDYMESAGGGKGKGGKGRGKGKRRPGAPPAFMKPGVRVRIPSSARLLCARLGSLAGSWWIWPIGNNGVGDWRCENEACGNVCFSWRDACNLCETARSAASYLAEAAAAKGKGKGKGKNPDDWECPTCGNFSASGSSRRRDCHFADTPLSIPIETPTEGRGGCSRMTAPPTATPANSTAACTGSCSTRRPCPRGGR